MKIVGVHLSLAPALTALGHTVLDLRPPGGLVRLAPLLGDFEPDVLIQQECLGERTLLADLHVLTCPTVFWSIDTHLNAFWQRYYAAGFDLFCTTQGHWLPWFAARGGPAGLWLPWYGVARAPLAWEARDQAMAFVGRVTPHRPVRGWFTQLVQEQGALRLEQELSHEAMLELYDHAVVVPNEAICGEINFRLFEAASCGCAVVTPSVAGLDELFVPGEEVAVYHDGVELVEIARRLAVEPLQARLLGARARACVLSRHLPEHRARTLLDAVEGLMPSRRDRRGVILALHQLRTAGRMAVLPDRMERLLRELPLDADTLAALLRLRQESGRDAFVQLAVPVSANGQYAESPEVNLAGSLGALRLGETALARHFLLRHCRHWGRPPGPTDSPVSICLAWARELQRVDELSRPGFLFDLRGHVPESALECLVLASTYAQEDREIYRLMARITARGTGWEGLRLQALSYLSLHQPADWRLGLDLGLTNCRAFRVAQGLEELLLALGQARETGEEQRFWAMLRGMDHSGRITAALQGNDAPGA